MRVFGITGASGSGKTTLIVRLLPVLRARGLSVSTIKHAHHGFDLDRQGKDSWAHRQAGAEEVLVAGDGRWALLREEPANITLDGLLARLAPVDLVLVEGFRQEAIAMLEVHRPALGKPPFYPDRQSILAVATDTPLSIQDRIHLDLNDENAIADFIQRKAA